MNTKEYDDRFEMSQVSKDVTQNPVDDIKQEMPEYTEALESQLRKWIITVIAQVEWTKDSAHRFFTVTIPVERMQNHILNLAKGSHTGIWLKELVSGCFPDATPLIDANEHLGICHPEQAYLGVPAVIVQSLHNYVEHGQETGSFLRKCLENDFLEAGMKADHINGVALPQIAKYIFHELPDDSNASCSNVKWWLTMTDDERKQYLETWRESERSADANHFGFSDPDNTPPSN